MCDPYYSKISEREVHARTVTALYAGHVGRRGERVQAAAKIAARAGAQPSLAAACGIHVAVTIFPTTQEREYNTV